MSFIELQGAVGSEILIDLDLGGSFDVSQQQCEDRNATLGFINNDVEFNFVNGLIRDLVGDTNTLFYLGYRELEPNTDNVNTSKYLPVSTLADVSFFETPAEFTLG